MDQPGLDPELHAAALAGLARLNRMSGSSRLLWPPIKRLARERNGRPLRVLDVASGGGDVAIALWRRAQAAGVSLQITGFDVSPTAVAHASRAAAAAGCPAEFVQRDLFASPPEPGHDAVTCSLFLHHLTSGQAVSLLGWMAASTERLVLVNDLVRSRLGKLLADVACRLLSRSPVVRVDGPRSVEGAFNQAEAGRLCHDAGLSDARITPRFPCRMLIEWNRHAE